MDTRPFYFHIDAAPESSQWKVEARAGRTVEAIKQFRANYGAALKESKDVVLEYQQRIKTGMASENVRTVTLPNGNVITISPARFDGEFNVTVTKSIATSINEHDLPQYIVKATLEAQDQCLGPARG